MGFVFERCIIMKYDRVTITTDPILWFVDQCRYNSCA
jgi:hypothetical protein